MVIVELPAPPAIDVGLKLTVTPLGAPVADNEIAELNPPMLVVVIVDVPELPVATLTAVGEADTVKSGVGDVCWVTPRKARTEEALEEVPLPVPSSIVNCVPDIVICRVVLLVGQLAADHTCPLASAKDPRAIPPDTVSTNNEVLPSRNSIWQVAVHIGK
jgi:hypothetical protein